VPRPRFENGRPDYTYRWDAPSPTFGQRWGLPIAATAIGLAFLAAASMIAREQAKMLERSHEVAAQVPAEDYTAPTVPRGLVSPPKRQRSHAGDQR